MRARKTNVPWFANSPCSDPDPLDSGGFGSHGFSSNLLCAGVVVKHFMLALEVDTWAYYSEHQVIYMPNQETRGLWGFSKVTRSLRRARNERKVPWPV